MTNQPRPLTDDLAARLLISRRQEKPIDTPPSGFVPADDEAAYLVQHDLLGRSGERVAGWKVGAKSPDGPIQCAPLPASGVRTDPCALPMNRFPVLGLELEIAFRLGREWAPRSAPYADVEVLGSIASVAASIEIVSSRYSAWPNVEKSLQLADLQNHGALVVGPEIPYDASFAFTAPAARFEFDGVSVIASPARNPAGDPRRLLVWLVNHCRARGLAVTPDMILTTGSYTGLYFAGAAGTAVGCFEGIPSVTLSLT